MPPVVSSAASSMNNAMTPLMHTIALLAKRLFTAKEPPESADALTDSLIALINKVTIPVLKISQLPPRDPIEYYNIFASDALTICVFVMRKGATMPTHDHPQMTVFSKIVYGALHVTTYEFATASSATSRSPSLHRSQVEDMGSPMSNDDATTRSSSSPSLSSGHSSPSDATASCGGLGRNGIVCCSHATLAGEPPDELPAGSRLALVDTDGVITHDSPDSLLIIRPEGGPNMHTFTAVSDYVVLLDIIGPPYNDAERPCTYYREIPFPTTLPAFDSPLLDGDGPLSPARMVVKKRRDRNSAPPTTLKPSPAPFDEPSNPHPTLPPHTLARSTSPIPTSSTFKKSPPVFVPDLVDRVTAAAVKDMDVDVAMEDAAPVAAENGFPHHHHHHLTAAPMPIANGRAFGTQEDVAGWYDLTPVSDSPRPMPTTHFHHHHHHHELRSPHKAGIDGKATYRLVPPRLAWLAPDPEGDHDCTEMPYDGSPVHALDLERAAGVRDIELLTFVEKVLLVIARLEAASAARSAAPNRRAADVAVNG
ncbi:hypothetical protein HDU96_008652 [Phlyctochytrium bullatum]|nr:hypothetical protein HDU96_008652 [Phlyctochytrium bullatum]